MIIAHKYFPRLWGGRTRAPSPCPSPVSYVLPCRIELRNLYIRPSLSPFWLLRSSRFHARWSWRLLQSTDRFWPCCRRTCPARLALPGVYLVMTRWLEKFAAKRLQLGAWRHWSRVPLYLSFPVGLSVGIDECQEKLFSSLSASRT